MMNGNGVGGFLFFVLVMILFVFLQPTTAADIRAAVPPTAVFSQTTAVSDTLIVDREDDVDGQFECQRDLPNDCPLRRAIEIANLQSQKTTILFRDHLHIRLNKALPRLSAANTIIRAAGDQEVHVDGLLAGGGSIFFITGSNVVLDGLRIYGAGSGYSQIRVSGDAVGVVIANNIIGDDDAPANNCQFSNEAYGGIFIDTVGMADTTSAWVYGNIIECHRGVPGQGITVLSPNVVIGASESGVATADEINQIRFNDGDGVYVGDVSGVAVQNSHFHENGGAPYLFLNHDYDVFNNEVTSETP